MNLPQVTISPKAANLDGVPEALRRRFLNPGEIDILVELSASVEPKRMVEFGCQNGRTARVLLDNLPTLIRYIGLDVPQNYVTPCKVQRGEVPQRPGELAFSDPRFVLMLNGRGSHAITADDIGPIDVAFIDGDHSVDGVMNDYRLCRSCMAPGGLIVFHDYHDLGTVGVKDALHQLAERGADIQHVAGTWICFQRLPGEST